MIVTPYDLKKRNSPYYHEIMEDIFLLTDRKFMSKYILMRMFECEKLLNTYTIPTKLGTVLKQYIIQDPRKRCERVSAALCLNLLRKSYRSITMIRTQTLVRKICSRMTMKVFSDVHRYTKFLRLQGTGSKVYNHEIRWPAIFLVIDRKTFHDQKSQSSLSKTKATLRDTKK